jgi:hypothetical protein
MTFHVRFVNLPEISDNRHQQRAICGIKEPSATKETPNFPRKDIQGELQHVTLCPYEHIGGGSYEGD